MMKLFVVLATLVLVKSAHSQCLSSNDEAGASQPSTLRTLYAGQKAFTLRLFEAVNGEHAEGNVFFSPFSVYHALLLAYFSAANQTEQGLRVALLLANETKLDVMRAYKLDQYQRSLRSSDSYEFSSANRVYVEKHLPIRSCMLDFFQNEIETMDFRGDSEAARVHINNFVFNQTKANIKDLIPEDGIDSETQLVIANAAYFKGVWSSRFQADATHKEIFYITPDKQTFVDMMKQKGKFNYGVNEELGAQILQLRYKGDDVSMFILLPPFSTAQGVDKILKNLTPQILAEIVDEDILMTRQVELQLPKFTLEKSLPLKAVLNSMGVGDLFEPSSDFSWLTGEVGPHFNDATHKAKIRIDEDGTVAAAATAIFSFRSSRPAEPVVFNCNYPFVYFLYDHSLEAVTFMGVFRDPKDLN